MDRDNYYDYSGASAARVSQFNREYKDAPETKYKLFSNQSNLPTELVENNFFDPKKEVKSKISTYR